MDYVAKASKAQSLIHKNGGTIQIKKVTPGTYDGGARTRAADAINVSDITAVVVETDAQQANTFVPGTMQYSRMRDLLIAGMDLPNGLDQANDKFIFENSEWRIITFDLLAPDRVTKILYTVTVGN